MKQKLKRSGYPKKAVAIVAVVVLLLAASGGYFWHRHQRSVQSRNVAKTADVGPNFINYGPPTEQEKKDAQDHKDELSKQIQDGQQNGGDTSNGKQSVKPVITSISTVNNQVTVTAYVSGIFEDNGTCTLTATKDSQRKTFTAKAFANATTTDCTPFRLDPSEFPGGGTWKFSITYASDTAAGTSDVKDYKVN